MTPPNRLPAWQALAQHREAIAGLHLRNLFADDPRRFERFSIQFGDILFDFSKNRMTAETLGLLMTLAEQSGLKARIDAMFAGERINITERRSVLHVALRNRSNQPILVDGKDVMSEVNKVLEKMGRFTDAVRSGAWTGSTGKKIRTVVNIGIGGSDLGPRMVVSALAPYTSPELRVRFVSNIDAADLTHVLNGVDPETTLFCISSKTFTTQETMTNAQSARDWLLARISAPDAVARHFVAVSTNAVKVAEFGIDTQNMFEFWDWVGGRYSFWSAIGLPIALAIGMDRFIELLAGGHAVDEHFRSAPFAVNIPVIMGVLGVWYNNFFGSECHAILPYCQDLEHLPAYLQQADMESNGKSVDISGESINWGTGPIIFGQPGTNGQHAFYQLMHQGTKLIPCDFLAAIESAYLPADHHTKLLSNFFAQTEALMRGRTFAEAREELTAQGYSDEDLDEIAAAKVFPGNRPSNAFLYRRLTPSTLGSLVAFYEHKVFVQGAIWNINSFDQMGVELGKQLAHVILPELASDDPVDSHDSSTNGLINYFKTIRAGN